MVRRRCSSSLSECVRRPTFSRQRCQMKSTPSQIGGMVMRVVVLSLVSLSLLIPCATAVERKTQKDDIKIEARGTIKKSTQTVYTQTTKPAIFVTPPNPCAAGFLYEAEVKRYKFQLGAAKIAPRIDWETPEKKVTVTFSLSVRGGKDLELDI